jgi:hypothetical protein
MCRMLLAGRHVFNSSFYAEARELKDYRLY